MLNGSKTRMKESKNRRGLTQAKAVFCIIKKQEILIHFENKEIHAKGYRFWLCCTFWASYWHIKCKINWERTFKCRLTDPFIEKMVSFWDSVKKAQSWSIKKVILKNFAIIIENMLPQHFFRSSGQQLY